MLGWGRTREEENKEKKKEEKGILVVASFVPSYKAILTKRNDKNSLAS
jgi:hypothetical protein